MIINKHLSLLIAVMLAGQASLPGADDYGKTGIWDGPFPVGKTIKADKRIECMRKLGTDDIKVSNWDIWESMPSGKKADVMREEWQKYKDAGLQLHMVGIASEGAVKPGEYLKGHPTQLQWFYKWITAKAQGNKLTLELPKDVVANAAAPYFFIKDTTKLFLQDGKIDYDALKSDRTLKASDWQITGKKLIINSKPGDTYTAYVPCESPQVSLLPLDSQKAVVEKLDKFLEKFKGIDFITWEAVASMACYKGDTWADCNPTMQEEFQKTSGLKFDPELVELDPVYWEKWTNFKTDTVAKAIEIISKTLHKYNVKHDYYIGDFTYSGSYDSLGKAGLDYILGWSSTWNGKWEGGGTPVPDWAWEYIWSKAFWGSWEKKPAYAHLYWLYNEKRRPNGPDNYDSMVKWWWNLTWRGAINNALPDKLWWGINTSQNKPTEEQLKAIHDISAQYKYIYELTKKFKIDWIGNGYIPSLGPNLYTPSVFGLFTRQGYLWDTPVKWKHVDLTELSAGHIPKDCNLLLLPSEPFMSGMIDEKVVGKIKEWVEAGHSLLVLRAATYTDINGKDKAFAPIREITGVDYKKGGTEKFILASKTKDGNTNSLSAGLPEKINISLNEKYLVQFSQLKYDLGGSYYPTHPVEWFLGTQKSRLMIRQLLPDWRDYSELGARTHGNSATILYQVNNSPFLAIKELGKGRVAYLAKEYDLPEETGHELLKGMVYWLLGKNPSIKADNWNLDVTLRFSETKELMALEYNPKQDQSIDSKIRISEKALTENTDYIVLNQNPADLLDSEFLKNGSSLIWQKKDIIDGYKVSTAPWQLRIQFISPSQKGAILFEHAFVYQEQNIEGFSSYNLKFKEITKVEDTKFKLVIDAENATGSVLELDYMQKPVSFNPEKLRVKVSPDKQITIYENVRKIASFRGGKLTLLDKQWAGSYDENTKELALILK